MAFGSVLVVLTFVAAFVTVTPVRAAPGVVFGPPHIEKQVILPQTSIDGPALWTSSSDFTRAVLAYTGTDAAHHLNVMTSSDGVTYTHKRTLNETSFVRPAVVRMRDAAGGVVSVAWAGTDTRHTLNVLFDAYSTNPKKLTLWGETTFTAPALTFLDGSNFLLAWAGTDANHTLNVMAINFSGPALKVGAKTILWGYRSAAGPSLTWDPNTPGFLMSWTNNATRRVEFALSKDGLHDWMKPSASPLPEWASGGPSMIAYHGTPAYFLGWAGTDARHLLNVQYTEAFPRWPDAQATKTTFSQMCLGGPALGYTGVYRQVIVTWTGTDAAHHLNVAQVGI